jgi:hypothetical protein
VARSGRLGDRIDIDTLASCRLPPRLVGAYILHNRLDTIMRYEPRLWYSNDLSFVGKHEKVEEGMLVWYTAHD